jgi:hypothetical protein
LTRSKSRLLSIVNNYVAVSTENRSTVFQRGFQTHQIAFCSQACTHGALPLSGLHGEHAYFMFLR